MFYGLDATTARFWRQPAEPSEAALYREQYFHARTAESRKVSRVAPDDQLARRAMADAVVAMARHMSVI